MDLGLTDRTALVLGSTGGVGLATARMLAAEGAAVVFTGRRAELAESTAAEFPSSLGLGVDLSDRASVDAALLATQDRYGHVDVVVLNSGGPPPGGAVDLGRDDLAGAVETLLLAQLDVVARLLPGMRERGWGRIVAVGSSGVQSPIPGLVQSNIMRAGLAGYLKTLAREVAADGVTVNMVLPGRIDTDRVAQLDANRAKTTGADVAQVREQAEAAIPAKRYGTPEEFAAAVTFLCGAAASYITGEQLRVDGGMVGSY